MSLFQFLIASNLQKEADLNSCIKFTNIGNVNTTLGISVPQFNTITLFKSIDGYHWLEWDLQDIVIGPNKYICIKGDNPQGFNSTGADSNCSIFTGALNCTCEGNIMSLLGDNITNIPRAYCFSNLFAQSGILTAPELPALNIEAGCYYGMFKDCANLIKAPELPATELKTTCYGFMFENCTSLVTAPSLPAVSLLNANNCYMSMFRGCPSIKEIYCNAMYYQDGEIITTTIGSFWLDAAPSTTDCIFHKNPEWAGPTRRNVSTIPENWQIVDWVQD